MYIPTQAPPHLKDHDELRRWVEEELRRLGSAWAEMATTLDAVEGAIEAGGIDYTPTVSISGGAGTATGRYKLSGKLLYLQVLLYVTSTGSPAYATLPSGMVAGGRSGHHFVLAGRENASTGFEHVAVTGLGLTDLYFSRYDNVSTVTAGWQIHVSGVIEVV